MFPWLPIVRTSPELPFLVLTLLALSFVSLCIAAVEPGYLVRYRSVRLISHYRGQIACFGGAMLFCALVIYVLP